MVTDVLGIAFLTTLVVLDVSTAAANRVDYWVRYVTGFGPYAALTMFYLGVVIFEAYEHRWWSLLFFLGGAVLFFRKELQLEQRYERAWRMHAGECTEHTHQRVNGRWR